MEIKHYKTHCASGHFHPPSPSTKSCVWHRPPVIRDPVWCVNFFLNIYTQTKIKQHRIFSESMFLEVAERNMWVMEIKYFEFYCKFYYFYEHFELKMILWTKYLDNSRPCTKQVKMMQQNNEKSLYQMSENHFQLEFKQYGIISSRTSTCTSLLRILEKIKSLAYVFNFRYRSIARPPVLLRKKILDR